MASTAQILANRENSKLSSGPATESGKQITSQNACQHNLTGGPALAPGESTEEYEQHIAAIIEEYEPYNDIAKYVVIKIAESMWRLDRCQRMEDELIASSPNPFMEEDETLARKLERLERYKQAIERTYHRFVKEWRNLVDDDLKHVKLEESASRRSMMDFFNAPLPRTESPIPS